MSEHQLNIRNDEAYERAHSLAQRLGRSLDDVVVQALRRLDEATPTREPPKLTPEQEADFTTRIRTLQAQVRRELPPGTTSDHSDLYDENGLPR